MAPTIINTFLESYDFSGKSIILFATSGGSGFGKSIEELSPSCPNAVIREGRMLNGNPSEQELRQWVESLEKKEKRLAARFLPAAFFWESWGVFQRNRGPDKQNCAGKSIS